MRRSTAPTTAFLLSFLGIFIIGAIIVASGMPNAWWIAAAVCVPLLVVAQLIIARREKRLIRESVRQENERDVGNDLGHPAP